MGTTNSAVAIIEAGRPKVFKRTTREAEPRPASIVAISNPATGWWACWRKGKPSPTRKIRFIPLKRLIGRKFEDDEVKKRQRTFALQNRKIGRRRVKVKMSGKGYRPEEISAMILQKIKHDAEARLGGKVEGR